MENIESRFFSERNKAEINEINPVIDLFSTLEEVKTAKKRLYRHRSPEAQKVWNKLPDFLEKNKDLLSFFMGSKDVVAHLAGSMLLGVGTEGKRAIIDEKQSTWHMWDIPPSDIDLLFFVGEKDENEQKYQAKYGAEDRELSDSLKEIERVDRFFEQSNFEKEFNFREEGAIVWVPELTTKIKEICKGQEITDKEFFPIYKTAMLFGSDALFQSNKSIESKWRNEILKILLENPGGEVFWNEGIRKYFNLYFAGYEENPFVLGRKSKESHKKRVDVAFDKILSEKNVPPRSRERAKNALSKQRSKIQLPEFKVIESLKEKLK